MPENATQLTIQRETRITYGPVPHALDGEPLAQNCWQLRGDEFLLRGEGDHFFYYRKGDGITVERGKVLDLSEESLWLNGTVYAAVASLNELLPVHASAVAHDGKVFAFAGPGGAGKSTLIAALGGRGLPMFCDDTLVLDISDPQRILCLPGHKRLKLTADALKLTGATREEKVSLTVEKFYALPPAGNVRSVLPLAELIFLEDGPEPKLTPILEGGERLIRMQDDHQTAFLFAAARKFDRAGQFAHLSQLAGRIRMSEFVRPRDRSRFHEGVALVAEHVTSPAK
jgi:hypothetical protein